jgi:hypothetical protein
MNEQIARLGFDAWADNLIVDFIENHPEMRGNYGSITTERKDGTAIRAVYEASKATVVVRGYTGSGWETWERVVNL